MNKYDMTEVEHAYQSIQLALGAVYDATKSKDYQNIPTGKYPRLSLELAWKELTDRMYMVARQAAFIAELCGDDKTANYTNNLCDSLMKLTEE